MTMREKEWEDHLKLVKSFRDNVQDEFITALYNQILVFKNTKEFDQIEECLANWDGTLCLLQSDLEVYANTTLISNINNKVLIFN